MRKKISKIFIVKMWNIMIKYNDQIKFLRGVIQPTKEKDRTFWGWWITFLKWKFKVSIPYHQINCKCSPVKTMLSSQVVGWIYLWAIVCQSLLKQVSLVYFLFLGSFHAVANNDILRATCVDLSFYLAFSPTPALTFLAGKA